MNNMQLDQLKRRLDDISKEIEGIEQESSADNSLDVVIITSLEGVNKRIIKDKAPMYMRLIEERQNILNKIKENDNPLLNNNSNEENTKSNSFYQIINRRPNFNKNYSQRINEKKSVILTTTRDRTKLLNEPFDALRLNNDKDVLDRDELTNGVSMAKEKRISKDNVKKRILVDDSKKGFVSDAAFIIIISIFITAMIFLVAGFIIFK